MRRRRFAVDRARAGALLTKLQGQTRDLVERALVAAEREPDSPSAAHRVGSALEAVCAGKLLSEYAAALGTSEAMVRDCASGTAWPEAEFGEVVAELGWSRAVAIGRVGRLLGTGGPEVRDQLTRRAKDEGWTARRTAKEARQMMNSGTAG